MERNGKNGQSVTDKQRKCNGCNGLTVTAQSLINSGFAGGVTDVTVKIKFFKVRVSITRTLTHFLKK